MQRRFSGLIPFAIGIALLMSLPALAQYGYGQNPYPSRALPANTLPEIHQVGIRFATDVIAAIIGFIVGAFFSPLLRPFRRIFFFIVLAAITLYAWLGYAPISDWLTDIIAFFTFFVALGYGLRLGAKAFLAEKAEAERPTSFGSAKWATLPYLQTNGLLNGNGFLLGSFIEDGTRKLIHYDGPRHLLTVAPTRSGKGVSSIIPNLLTYEGAAFVIDPKGENALITATRRGQGEGAKGIKGLGQSIHLLDPWNIAAGKLGVKPACASTRSIGSRPTIPTQRKTPFF